MTNARIQFYGTLFIVVGVSIGARLYHHSADEDSSRQMELAVPLLKSFPHHFGKWHLEGEAPLGTNAEELLQCSAYLNRVYRNDLSGAVVGLVLLIGPAGPLVAHTPQVCMSSQQYEPIGGSKAFSLAIGDQEHQFMEAQFQARTVEGNDLTIYYGWSRNGGQWEAPKHPRLTLGPSPFLYKVQVVLPSLRSSVHDPDAISQDFLQEFVPILRSTLTDAQPITTATHP